LIFALFVILPMMMSQADLPSVFQTKVKVHNLKTNATDEYDQFYNCDTQNSLTVYPKYSILMKCSQSTIANYTSDTCSTTCYNGHQSCNSNSSGCGCQLLDPWAFMKGAVNVGHCKYDNMVGQEWYNSLGLHLYHLCAYKNIPLWLNYTFKGESTLSYFYNWNPTPPPVNFFTVPSMCCSGQKEAGPIQKSEESVGKDSHNLKLSFIDLITNRAKF